MVKKNNSFGAAVKLFLEKTYSQSWIANEIKPKRQRVSYWAHLP